MSGDFDGQDMSFGQGSLQPLLRDMINEDPETMKAIFYTNNEILSDGVGKRH